MANVQHTSANHAEHALSPSNVAQLRPRWNLSDNGSDFSAPIVVNGTLYYGSWNGNETAVNITSGAILWSEYLGTDPACGGYTPMGISSTPAFLNGTLYLGGGNGYWYALNASTGAVDWSYLVGNGTDGFYDWASATAYGHALYIGIASCFDSPLVPAGLLELNISGTSPTLAARFNTTPTGLVGESIWATPALDPQNNTIWVATGNENPPGYPRYANAIIGLNATTLNVTGSWQVPAVAGQDADFGSTPVLFQAGSNGPMVVATDKNGVAFALNRSNVSANGSWGPSWTLNTGGGFSGGAFDGSTLYLAGGASVYAVDPGNGTVRWTAGMSGGGTILGSLAWANGVVYATGGSEVEAIDASNGTVLWNATFAPGQNGVTEPVVASGELFVASGDYGTQGFLTAYGLPSSPVYPVIVSETGLPAGKAWGAIVGGLSQASTTTPITFVEGNGTYGYLVHGPAGFRVTGGGAQGNVTVAGAPVHVSITFARGSTRTLSFHETGLTPGTLWCVNVAHFRCSVRGTITIGNLTPGSYAYTVGAVPQYSLVVLAGRVVVNWSGEANLTLRGLALHAAFAPILYAVTFNQSGLPPTFFWHVGATCTVPRHAHTGCYGMSAGHGGRGSSLTLGLREGTYVWHVAPVRGYVLVVNHVMGWTGNLTVSGPEFVNVTFLAKSSTPPA